MLHDFFKRLTKLSSDQRGVAAIEFALLAPALLLLVGLLVDFGRGFNAQLRLGAALHAGAQFALVDGGSVTVQSAPAFLDRVSMIVKNAASFTQAPTVTVKYNNAAGGGNAGNFYCVTGNGGTAWASTGSSSATCGGALTSGKFVTISATATMSYFFLPSSFAGRITSLSDTVIVRVK